jgi:uncharacterized membrane protein
MAVGFVTRVLADSQSGRQLAAVYVPTAPNPTSGYMELVPLEDLISTYWTVEEGMRFVLSAGTAGPDRVAYDELETG